MRMNLVVDVNDSYDSDKGRTISFTHCPLSRDAL